MPDVRPLAFLNIAGQTGIFPLSDLELVVRHLATLSMWLGGGPLVREELDSRSASWHRKSETHFRIIRASLTRVFRLQHQFDTEYLYGDRNTFVRH